MPDAAIGYQVNPVEDWTYHTTPLPPGFIDLAQAAKVARQHGMKAMNAADLRIFAPDGRPPVLAWQIRDSSRAWYVDGLSGAMLVGDVSGEVRPGPNHAWGAQSGEHAVRDSGDHVQHLGEQVEILLGGGDRDDAGGHDEREVSGEQCGDRRGPGVGHDRVYGRK